MTPETNQAVAQAEGASSQPKGFFGRLSGIYFTPGETFAEFKFDKSLFVPIILPIFISMSLGAFTNYIVTNRIGYENIVRKQMQSVVDSGWMTQEQADEVIRQSANRSTLAKVRDLIIPFIFGSLMIIAIAGIFRLFSMVMGAENGFKPLIAVTAYTFVAIGIIQVILMTLVLYLKNPDEIDLYNPIGSNLGAILPAIISDPPRFLTSLASWVDVFGIWRVALLSIGYAAVSRRMKTSTAAIFMGLLYVLMAFVGSAIAAAFS